MDNGWFVFYIVGCVFAFVIGVVNTVIGWLLRWMTKSNVVLRNLRKLDPLDETSFAWKAFAIVAGIIVQVALSWVSVALGIWQLIREILSALREAFSSKPEKIKSLVFPLRNNPNLSREAVWAYSTAVLAANGHAVTNPNDLLKSLGSILDNYADFDRRAALQQLKLLEIIDPHVISAAILQVTNSGESFVA